MSVKRPIRSMPWWLPNVTTIVLFVLLIGGTIVVGKVLSLEVDSRNILLGFGFILAIVILSSLIGAVVARLTASQHVLIAEGKLTEAFKSLGQQADRFQEESQKLSNLPEKCQKRTKLLDDAIKSAKEITHMALEKFGRSIVTYHDLMKIESSVERNGEIWILTSALELEDEDLKEIIHANFNKGIKYTYLIPKEPKRLQKRMIKLAKQWKNDCNLSVESARKQIECHVVPQHFAYMTVIIYNPYEACPTVLVKFPTSDIYEKAKYPLIYRVDSKPEAAGKTFVDAIQELIYKPSCSQVEKMTIDFF